APRRIQNSPHRKPFFVSSMNRGIALSLIAVILDLASKDAADGKRFYAVLRWSQKCQRMTNLYSMLKGE
ncbi:MAG: hypothetical protein ACP5QR_11740, partial [Rhizomicrobium sp.]